MEGKCERTSRIGKETWLNPQWKDIVDWGQNILSALQVQFALLLIRKKVIQAQVSRFILLPALKPS